ncbi:hypothetical protein LCL87_17115 [Rhodococcus hoagii]|nr:hypothetical protein [Prescottella equi]
MSRVEMILLDAPGALEDVASELGRLRGVSPIADAPVNFVFDGVSVEVGVNRDPEDANSNHILTLWSVGDGKIERQMRAAEDLYNQLVAATSWGLELWFSDDSDEQDPHSRPRLR